MSRISSKNVIFALWSFCFDDVINGSKFKTLLINFTNLASNPQATVNAVTYSTLEVVLNIQRIGSFCVMTQFVPLAMLVLTSLIALWIPTDKAVKIGITVLLLISVSFKAENINNGLPFTNYTKEPTLK